MPQHVECPGCNLRLRYTGDLDGKPGVCPECEHLILPREESTDAADETLRTVKPINDRLDDLRREGRALAREHALVLHAVPQFESLDEAAVDASLDDLKRIADAWNKAQTANAAVEASLNELKRGMPVTESAYQPSGKLSRAALGVMLVGTGVAIGAALLAEFVLGVFAAVIGLAALAIHRTGYLTYCAFAILGVLIALAAAFAAGGFTAAIVTIYFGQIGKNRNVIVASFLSTTAAAVSVLIVWVLYFFVGAPMFDGMDLHATVKWIGVGVGGVGGVGSLLAVFIAFISVSGFVKDAKFCEECEEYMEESELGSLRIGSIQGMVLALQDEKPAVAASMLCSDPADEGKAMLYHCPVCDAGYIEVKLQFKAKWQENGSNQTREETWRVASVPLNKYDVEWFRIFKAEAGGGATGDNV